MNEFDTLKNSWKQQTIPQHLEQLKIDTLSKFKKQQAKVVFSNLLSSICFAGVFIEFALVWRAFPNQSIFFYGSLVFMYILLIVMLVVLWMGVQYRKPNAAVDTKSYLEQCLKKLYHRRKTQTQYSTIYNVLLFAALTCYMYDLSIGREPLKIIIMYGVTVSCFVLMILITRRRKIRKLKELNELIFELETAKNQLDK